MIERKLVLLRKDVLNPIELSSLALVVFGMLVVWWLPISASDQRAMFLWLLASAFYVLLYYHWLHPRYKNSYWVNFAPVIFNTAVVTGVNYWIGGVANVQVIYVLIIVSAAVRLGRQAAIVASLLSGASMFMIELVRLGLSFTNVASISVTLIVYLTAGYLSGTLAARLHSQIERMGVLNEVAQVLSLAVEMDAVFEQIHQKLSRIVPVDTYYVGILEPSKDLVNIEFAFDDGKRSPAQRIPYGDGLPSLVIQRRKPLLIRRFAVERANLPPTPAAISQAGSSESWLGVPLLMSEGYSGVLAIASHKPNAFDEDDVALLSNVARQVALALDNARHLAQVEKQACQDSLTGVYNHGYLLQRLQEEIDTAKGNGSPVSFIMLDIDHFKEYNDTYGHVIGDQVLHVVVQAIRAHVKRTDVVGRWGGEEFGIVLPNMTTGQGNIVANRIRDTLVALPLVDGSGHAIPKPTVSQGIATFPDHVADANQLVDVADAMLYQAKKQGRDQVRVADSMVMKEFHDARPN
jgi:diguanylate cyclase (GGDEF)-like protein